MAQSSNFQTSGIEVFKNSGKNPTKNYIKIKTVLFIDFFSNYKCTKYITPRTKRIQTHLNNFTIVVLCTSVHCTVYSTLYNTLQYTVHYSTLYSVQYNNDILFFWSWFHLDITCKFRDHTYLMLYKLLKGP